MKPDDFRKVALSMPEAVEGSHMDHPDFRVNNKIFATLWPHDGVIWGMVKLTPAQQKQFVKSDPDVFAPIPGGWGRRGATRVYLKAASKKTVRPAMFTAWLNTAPKKLIKEIGGEVKE